MSSSLSSYGINFLLVATFDEFCFEFVRMLLSNHPELGRSTFDDGLVIVGDPSVPCVGGNSTICWTLQRLFL